jgi:hypothetical protein
MPRCTSYKFNTFMDPSSQLLINFNILCYINFGRLWVQFMTNLSFKGDSI